MATHSDQHLLNVYKRIALDIAHGEGVHLYTKNGEAYLDFLSGIAVNALGYNHPAVKKALARQADRNLHLSNFFVQDVQRDLANRLCELTPFEHVFFSNSGTEATEGVLKLVKKWGNQNGKKTLVSFEGSFHGRTLGAVSITGQEKYRKSFKPLLTDTQIVPFNNPEALKAALNNETCAVFFEGISGEGGIRELSEPIRDILKEGRDTYGFLLVADEIQTGVGRTGRFYNYEHYDFVPDIIMSAKGLGGGLPLGAFLVKQELGNVFDVGEHGTTYGGNPLACATGLATVDIVREPAFLQSVAEKGVYFSKRLEDLKAQFPAIIKDVRGRGLMLGVELHDHGEAIFKTALEQKLILNLAGGGKVLRFVPPLIINKAHIDEAIMILQSALTKLQ